MNREEILDRLREDFGLPALPEVLLRLDQELRDPEVDLRKVTELASSDQVLAGQVVRMANSAYYSRGGARLTGLSPAVQRLGLRALRGLVFALTLPRMFRNSTGEFPIKDLWRHSLAVASLASGIAEALGLPASVREEAWLGGLVHDIGALALSSIAGIEYDLLVSGSRRTEPDWTGSGICSLEAGAFGIDHAEAGGIFLRDRWRMPEPIPEIAFRHHDLGSLGGLPKSSEQSTIHLVHVANGICSSFGASWNAGNPRGEEFREEAWEALGLDLEKVEDLVGRTRASLDLAETMLSAGG